MLNTIPNVFPVSRLPSGQVPFEPRPRLAIGNGGIQTLVGNHCVGKAAAQAMLAQGSGATAAYPITPSTEILHYIRQLEAEGAVPSIGYNASAEHEAMSVILGAAYGGARSFIATSSLGFMHMLEMVEWGGQNRMPVVMALVNRANAPLNIWFGEEDRARARDFTVQLVAENHQQCYDLTLQAFRVAEAASWMTIVNLAGFFISHSADQVRILADDVAGKFVGKLSPRVDPFGESISKGGLTSPRAFPLQRAQNLEAWAQIKGIVQKVHDEYGAVSGRSPGAFFNTYYAEDAEYLFVNYGFLSGTLRTLIDIARRAGVPVGLVSGTMLRPFPGEELVAAITKTMPKVKAIGVIDATLDPVPGMIYGDLGLAFQVHHHGKPSPLMINFRYDGGQNPSLSVMNGALQRLMAVAQAGSVEHPIQQLDRNSEGTQVALAIEGTKSNEALAKQAVIEFVGRGGLGAVSSAANLSFIINEKGAAFSRGIPQFGSEKTGSPTFAVSVIDDHPIANFNIEGPRDLYVYFRPDLISPAHFSNVKPGGFFIVNTAEKPDAVRAKYGVPVTIPIYTIDASDLSRQALHKDFPNNVLLAALSSVRPDLLSLADLSTAIKRSLKKKGPEIIALNMELIEKAHLHLNKEGAV